jgi:hypothetical protein
MTVLKRTSKQTKRQRDDNLLRLEMFEFAMKCTMLAANKNQKMRYGNVRGGRLIQEIADIMDEYCERYEPEFFITAVDKELADRGLSLDIKWN